MNARDPMREAFASVQKLALAGQYGDVNAHEACREIADRLPYLMALAETHRASLPPPPSPPSPPRSPWWRAFRR